jgi:hypothetical protein
MPENRPTVVVVAPDVLGRSFDEVACARLLVAWRDGRVVPALNRQLLQLYLKVLQNLGVNALLLRRWAWWFTAADKVRFLDNQTFPGATGRTLCTEVAKAAGAACVIALEVPAPSEVQTAESVSGESAVPWTTPQGYLETLTAGV